MKKLLVVAAIAVGITACADKDETPPELQESAVPTVGASSSAPAPTDEFGEMMNEGAQAQIQQRPEEAAQLAADFASITGEQVTVVAAQQMSNIVCLDMENAQGPGALGAVSAAMATETGVSAEMMTRVAEKSSGIPVPGVGDQVGPPLIRHCLRAAPIGNQFSRSQDGRLGRLRACSNRTVRRNPTGPPREPTLSSAGH